MLKARLQVLAAAALFSTGGVAIKACSLGGFEIACFRSGVAAVVLMLFLPGWRRFWEPRSLLVGTAYAATLVLYVSATKLTTAANAIFLQATAPLYLLALGPWLLGEHTPRRDLWLGAVLACGLSLFFVGTEPAQVTAPEPVLGNWLGAASGVTWALTLLGLRWLGRGDQPDPQASGRAALAGNWIAFGVCLPFAVPSEVGVADASVILYLGAIQIGLAYVWLTRGVSRLRTLEVSFLIVAEPVLNALLTWAVLGERLGPWSALGCAVVLAATLLLAFRPVPDSPPGPGSRADRHPEGVSSGAGVSRRRR